MTRYHIKLPSITQHYSILLWANILTNGINYKYDCTAQVHKLSKRNFSHWVTFFFKEKQLFTLLPVLNIGSGKPDITDKKTRVSYMNYWSQINI